MDVCRNCSVFILRTQPGDIVCMLISKKTSNIRTKAATRIASIITYKTNMSADWQGRGGWCYFQCAVFRSEIMKAEVFVLWSLASAIYHIDRCRESQSEGDWCLFMTGSILRNRHKRGRNTAFVRRPNCISASLVVVGIVLTSRATGGHTPLHARFIINGCLNIWWSQHKADTRPPTEVSRIVVMVIRCLAAVLWASGPIRHSLFVITHRNK